ncbi:hypothetical protein D3C79_1002650 [compost metagenome]
MGLFCGERRCRQLFGVIAPLQRLGHRGSCLHRACACMVYHYYAYSLQAYPQSCGEGQFVRFPSGEEEQRFTN